MLKLKSILMLAVTITVISIIFIVGNSIAMPEINPAAGFEISNLKYNLEQTQDYILIKEITLDFKGAKGMIKDAINWIEPLGQCCIYNFSQKNGTFIVNNGSCKIQINKLSTDKTYYIHIYLKDSEGRDSNLLRIPVVGF